MFTSQTTYVGELFAGVSITQQQSLQTADQPLTNPWTSIEICRPAAIGTFE